MMSMSKSYLTPTHPYPIRIRRKNMKTTHPYPIRIRRKNMKTNTVLAVSVRIRSDYTPTRSCQVGLPVRRTKTCGPENLFALILDIDIDNRQVLPGSFQKTYSKQGSASVQGTLP